MRGPPACGHSLYGRALADWILHLISSLTEGGRFWSLTLGERALLWFNEVSLREEAIAEATPSDPGLREEVAWQGGRRETMQTGGECVQFTIVQQ